LLSTFEILASTSRDFTFYITEFIKMSMSMKELWAMGFHQRH